MLLDKFLKKSSKPPKADNFFIFIESPIKVVGPQIFLWSQANWWPEKCDLEVVDIPAGGIRPGTQSVHTIKGIFTARLESQVSQVVPERLIERTFTKGLLKGTETISVEERYNGTRLDVKLQARPRNIISYLLWPTLYRSAYMESIRLILQNIKNYCLSVQRL